MEHILISLLVLIIVGGLIWWLISMLPLPAPFKMFANVVLILIAIVMLCHFAGWLAW